jgi:outer membrane protein TolC
MSRISRKIDEGAMWPVVTGFFNYNYDYKKQNYMDNTRQWLTEWNAGLELAMPLDSLIPISKAAKQVKEEEGNFERLEWLKKQTEDSIQYGIRNLIDRIGYGRNVIECQLEIMDKARLSYEMALQRYKTWSSPAAEVNGVELTYYQARIDYLGALLDIYTNTVALHRMID